MRIKLLKDIDDNYYNIHLKAGQVVTVKTRYMYNGGKNNKGDYRDVIVSVNGHGAYTYARIGEYLIKIGDSYIDPSKMRIGELKPNID
jgi:hypothetical protein